MPDKKTAKINGKKFEVPDLELYCSECNTTNYIYFDMEPPYKCDNCGSPLEFDENEARYEQEEGRYHGEI
jgi:transcription initiation factor IIE alpha subunit